MNKVELFNDHFQNFKVYGIPKAQLIIADPPYNLWKNAYASNPSWYVDGDNKNGESDKAGKEFFDTDKDFESLRIDQSQIVAIVDKSDQQVTYDGETWCSYEKVYNT